MGSVVKIMLSQRSIFAFGGTVPQEYKDSSEVRMTSAKTSEPDARNLMNDY